MLRRIVVSVAFLLALGAEATGATIPDYEYKAWAFEIRGDGPSVFVGAWTRELCEKALRDTHRVKGPRIQAVGSCFAISFMGEQVGLEVWMVEPEGDTFILFPSREACDKLTAEVHEGAPDRPSCARVWVRTVV